MSKIGEIIKTEKVNEGQKARYPYSDEYETPQKQGYVFDGWKFNGQVMHPPFNDETQNPFGPINGDTNITAVWDKIDSLHCETTRYTLTCDGEDLREDRTLVSYWLSTVSGKTIAEGVEIEPVVDSDVEQYPIYIISGDDRVENGKNIRALFVAPNEDSHEKYYKFKAVTNADIYGIQMESDVITLVQEGKSGS